MTTVDDRTGSGTAVRQALAVVRDPELDEPITDLGFVTAVSVAGAHAEVRLRLPTYFCAPNFAYLMVADARDAVLAVPGIESADIVLEEHFASAEINAGVAAGSFTSAFGSEAGEGELEELRRNFQRKAHTACLERACQDLLRAGWTVEGLTEAHLGDLAGGERRDSLIRRRGDLGLSTDDADPIFVDDDGVPIPAAQAPIRLRFARTVRLSIEGNGHFCRGLLTTRYPEAAADQRPSHRELIPIEEARA
jgi:metal-sulfur cluster biosynthetic enzyme